MFFNHENNESIGNYKIYIYHININIPWYSEASVERIKKKKKNLCTEGAKEESWYREATLYSLAPFIPLHSKANFHLSRLSSIGKHEKHYNSKHYSASYGLINTMLLKWDCRTVERSTKGQDGDPTVR